MKRYLILIVGIIFMPNSVFGFDSNKKMQNKYSIAIMKIDARDSNMAKEALSMIEETFVNLNYFNIIDRNSLKDILKEQTLSLAGVVSGKTAIEVGWA